MYGKLPTNAMYGNAAYWGLIRARFSPAEAAQLAAMAESERSAYGLRPSDPVPRVPGRLPQKK